MRSWFRNLFRRNQVFGGHNLPLAVASHPGVRPHKTSSKRVTTAPLPCLVSLCYSGVAIESDFDVVGVIAEEILRYFASVCNHCGFVIEARLGVRPDEIISQDPLHRAAVARCN